jgi:hypothetical protein
VTVVVTGTPLTEPDDVPGGTSAAGATPATGGRESGAGIGGAAGPAGAAGVEGVGAGAGGNSYSVGRPAKVAGGAAQPNPVGIRILVAVADRKTAVPIVGGPPLKVMAAREADLKAPLPIEVTLGGTTIEVRPVDWKAYEPMLVSPDPNVAEVRPRL